MDIYMENPTVLLLPTRTTGYFILPHGLDGLKDASDCQIELPRGGVHTMTQEQEEYSASSSDVMEDGVMSSLLASLQRFMV